MSAGPAAFISFASQVIRIGFINSFAGIQNRDETKLVQLAAHDQAEDNRRDNKHNRHERIARMADDERDAVERWPSI